MRDTLAVTPSHGIDQLLEVELCNVLGDTLVGLDLVEQIASICEFERYPKPGWILPVMQVANDVLVTRDMDMDGYLDMDLLDM